jgi:hypothetical protein
MPSLRQASLPTLAAIVAQRPPMVSKVGSPRRHDAVGENLVDFGGPKRW